VKLFGTDGVRGVAGIELTPELALALGRAAGLLSDERSRAVLGRDTRRSGEMIGAALLAGMASAGIEALDIGVIPTPAIPFFVEEYQASFGVVVSASHNPAEDNGIKFFNRDGFKIGEELEAQLEEAVTSGPAERSSSRKIGRIKEIKEARGRYLDHLLRLGAELQGMPLKLVLDCANGATSKIAPELFSRLGIEAVSLHDQPDGDNINLGCGSTDLRGLQEAVLLYQADLGVAFDGDGDRALFVDHRGGQVDGDAVLLIAALQMKGDGALSPPQVVATVMSNLGLEEALGEKEIELIRTQVGDRYVAEKLEELRAKLGGEQSGHLIFREKSTTGDGLITALELLKALKRSGEPLADLATGLTRHPQFLHSVPVRDVGLFHHSERLQEAISTFKLQLDGVGRLLVRPSGTQPVIRVMVEGRDEALIRRIGMELGGLIARELNP
jgi:phosphoglucosamine mutase